MHLSIKPIFSQNVSLTQYLLLFICFSLLNPQQGGGWGPYLQELSPKGILKVNTARERLKKYKVLLEGPDGSIDRPRLLLDHVGVCSCVLGLPLYVFVI